MITGIGIDIFEISRLATSSDPNSFLEQIMNESELANLDLENSFNDASARYTIKEAVLKALGCGLEKGYFWKNIEIEFNEKITLKGELKKIADDRSIKNIHCSTTRRKQLSLSLTIMENDL